MLSQTTPKTIWTDSSSLIHIADTTADIHWMFSVTHCSHSRARLLPCSTLLISGRHAAAVNCALCRSQSTITTNDVAEAPVL